MADVPLQSIVPHFGVHLFLREPVLDKIRPNIEIWIDGVLMPGTIREAQCCPVLGNPSAAELIVSFHTIDGRIYTMEGVIPVSHIHYVGVNDKFPSGK